MLKSKRVKEKKRMARHKRIRRQVKGVADRPRLCVHRSLKNLVVQLVDDSTGQVLLGLSTLNKDVRKKIEYGGNVKGASVLGETFAILAKEKGYNHVAFDRGGYLYHGRIKAFAEAARKGGLDF